MGLFDVEGAEGELTPSNDLESSHTLEAHVRELSSQSPLRHGKTCFANYSVETVKALYAERSRLQKALRDAQVENKLLKERLEDKQNPSQQPSAGFQKQLQGMLNLGTSKDDMPVLSVMLDIKNTLMGFYTSLEKVSEQLKSQKEFVQRSLPAEGDRVWRNTTRLTHHDILSLSTELERRRLKLAGQLFGSQPYDQVDPITDRLISLYLLRESHEMTAQLEVMKQYVHDLHVLHEVEQQFRVFRAAHPMPTMEQLTSAPDNKAGDTGPAGSARFDPSRVPRSIQPFVKALGQVASQHEPPLPAPAKGGLGTRLSVVGSPRDLSARRSLSSPDAPPGAHAARLKPLEKGPTPTKRNPSLSPGSLISVQPPSPTTAEVDKSAPPFGTSPWLAPDKLSAAYAARMRKQNRRIASKLGV
eukprot:EG_transcript_9246